MSLKIELAQDQTKFYVELPSGHHILVPVNAGGAAALQRLLKQQIMDDVTEAIDRPIKGFISEAEAQIEYWKKWGVGSEASPTQQQFDHDLRHDPRWPRPNCAFCRAEEAAKSAKRKVRGKKAKTPELSVDDLDLFEEEEA